MKKKPLEEWTKEEKQAEIAKICGTPFLRFCGGEHIPVERDHRFYPVDKYYTCKNCDACKFASEGWWREEQPSEFRDYLGDLNAIRHVVFEFLDGAEGNDSRFLYRQALEGICSSKLDAIDATAEERADAFLIAYRPKREPSAA